MSDQNSTNKTVKKQYRPSIHTPELLELAVDVSKFTRKWKPPRLAKVLGITKQSLNEHIQKRKEVKNGGI